MIHMAGLRHASALGRHRNRSGKSHGLVMAALLLPPLAHKHGVGTVFKVQRGRGPAGAPQCGALVSAFFMPAMLVAVSLLSVSRTAFSCRDLGTLVR
jgi:hypothetical protein